MPTPEKKATVQKLADEFKEAKSLLLADYRGLDVEAVTDLRRRCRESDVRFRVAKNTLSRIALSEIGAPDLGEILEGPTGFAMAVEDQLAAARVLVEYAKKNEHLQVKGGLMDGRILTGDEIKALASLPSRDELIALLLAALQAPLTQVIGAGASLVNDVLSCAEQAAERRGAPDGSAEAAAPEAAAPEGAAPEGAATGGEPAPAAAAAADEEADSDQAIPGGQ